jgi:hypothetical protein
MAVRREHSEVVFANPDVNFVPISLEKGVFGSGLRYRAMHAQERRPGQFVSDAGSASQLQQLLQLVFLPRYCGSRILGGLMKTGDADGVCEAGTVCWIGDCMGTF